MRCVGRTKSFRRCRRDANMYLCSAHRFQPWTLLLFVSSLIGLYAGIFQDVVRPIWIDQPFARAVSIEQKRARTAELVSILELRATEIAKSMENLEATLHDFQRSADRESRNTSK